MHGSATVAVTVVLHNSHIVQGCVADYFDLVASIGVVTTGMASAHSAASKLMKLAVLSERMTSDAAFARQCQRKFC